MTWFVDGKLGTIVTGTWIRGRIGQGSAVYAGGDRYDGGFANNDFHGKGVYTSSDGWRYEGIFVDGDSQDGIITEPNGKTYKGSFDDIFDN
ncbi:MAG: hypothetical protein LBE24_00750 [Methylobacillus sp.]|nr:hypothetical protein [Methylobacillus sp.]